MNKKNDKLNLESGADGVEQTDVQSMSNEKPQADKPSKTSRLTKSEKKEAMAKAKNKSHAQKEWEDSIVSSKRVKREEGRRKWKKALILLLAFSMITTSIVYIMITFVDQNNIRITASSSDKEKSISLSMNNVNWSPYLDALGPDKMLDVSYNGIYGRENIISRENALEKVAIDNPFVGNDSGENFISFGFMLRNNSAQAVTVPILYEMVMRSNKRGLEKSIRVMWTESYSKQLINSCNIYAAPSDNERLAGLYSNQGQTVGNYIEKVAYPLGADNPNSQNYNLVEYELNQDVTDEIKQENGFFDTVPFASQDSVFQRESYLAPGEIMYIYVVVWIEGSDFDCVDTALGGYVTLGINFSVM